MHRRRHTVWHLANAQKSWEFYRGGQDATPYAAPARMQDLSGLPPTYLTVNELDPLRDEQPSGAGYAAPRARVELPSGAADLSGAGAAEVAAGVCPRCGHLGGWRVADAVGPP
jgi:acetyl esterase/lipase